MNYNPLPCLEWTNILLSASLGILMTTFYGNLNLFSHMGNFPGLMFFWNHIIIIYYD